MIHYCVNLSCWIVVAALLGQLGQLRLACLLYEPPRDGALPLGLCCFSL